MGTPHASKPMNLAAGLLNDLRCVSLFDTNSKMAAAGSNVCINQKSAMTTIAEIMVMTAGFTSQCINKHIFPVKIVRKNVNMATVFDFRIISVGYFWFCFTFSTFFCDTAEIQATNKLSSLAIKIARFDDLTHQFHA